MGEKEIYQWLHQAREAGLSDMKIVDKLKSQGWSNTDIDNILVGAYSENDITPPSKPTNNKGEKIFSPAEKFQKERKKDKNPLDKLENYKYSNTIGDGAFRRLWELIKDKWSKFLVYYLLITICLGGIIYTPESMTILSFGFTIATGLIIFLAFIMISRNDWSFKSVLQDYVQIFIKYIYTSFLAFFVMLGGYLLFIVPGILISISFTMLPYVIFNENKFGFKALIRSHELAKGHRGKIFGYSIIFNFVTQLFFSILITGFILLYTTIGFSENSLITIISDYGYVIFLSLLVSLSAIFSIAFYKAFYDDLAYYKPSDDLISDVKATKNNKFYISALLFLGSIFIITLIFLITSGVIKTNSDILNLDSINIGTQDLIESDIELVKLPFEYTPPTGFSNLYNNKYKNGYSSTYTYQVPNTTENININIYLEENDSNLTAETYLELNETSFNLLYDTSTVLNEGPIDIDQSTGYFKEKTYEFYISKNYSNTIVYTKRNYIIEITLECASKYYMDYKTKFLSSIDSFRMQ